MKRRMATRQAGELGLLAALALVVAVLAVNAVSFVADRNRLPATTMIADLDVSGMTPDEAISLTTRSLSAPVSLTYQGESIVLDPAAMDVRLNQAVARLQIDQILRQRQSLSAFAAQILRQTSARKIPAPILYSEGKLTAALLGIGARLDREPELAPVVPGSLKAPAVQPGRQLNLIESRDSVIDVLGRAKDRVVELPVDVVGGPQSSMKALDSVLRQELSAFIRAGGSAAVFVKNVRSGEELSISADYAVSASGWLKLLTVIEAARSLDGGLTGARGEQANAALVEGSDLRANELLRSIGGGDAGAGVARLNAFSHRMGLLSTFIAQPFGQTNDPVTYVTPGNATAPLDSALDVNAQSTPAEIGFVLEALGACRNGTGAFVAATRGQLTPARCEQVLVALGKNTGTGLMDANVGNAAIYHRQSWDANTHADAGLVMTGAADYVLVVALSQPRPALTWSQSSAIIGAVTRATHAFFNGGTVPAAAPVLSNPPAP